MLTIAYMTNRQNPRFHWFAESLVKQMANDSASDRPRLVVVDYWMQDNPHRCWPQVRVDDRRELFSRVFPFPFLHIPPKPSAWNGPYRLTKRDYFAASGARNTALCYAPDGHIAFVDDLSVLWPGWLGAVREAMAGNYIALGTYAKVRDLRVQGGVIESFRVAADEATGKPLGQDTRLASIDADPANRNKLVVDASGGWMFGCSVAGPVEAFLQVNGFDEDNDTQGGEDYLCGMMLERKGWQHRFCRRMATLEDDLAHGEEEPFRRMIKPYPDAGGNPEEFARRFPGEKDATHAILNQVLRGERLTAPNPTLGEGGLRALRAKVLAEGYAAFPTDPGPHRHWPDDQDLRDM